MQCATYICDQAETIHKRRLTEPRPAPHVPEIADYCRRSSITCGRSPTQSATGLHFLLEQHEHTLAELERYVRKRAKPRALRSRPECSLANIVEAAGTRAPEPRGTHPRRSRCPVIDRLSRPTSIARQGQENLP